MPPNSFPQGTTTVVRSARHPFRGSKGMNDTEGLASLRRGSFWVTREHALCRRNPDITWWHPGGPWAVLVVLYTHSSGQSPQAVMSRQWVCEMRLSLMRLVQHHEWGDQSLSSRQDPLEKGIVSDHTVTAAALWLPQVDRSSHPTERRKDPKQGLTQIFRTWEI